MNKCFKAQRKHIDQLLSGIYVIHDTNLQLMDNILRWSHDSISCKE